MGQVRAAGGRNGGVTRGCFRRRSLESSPELAAATLRAVARAKAGDRDAVRELYERYADNVYGYVLSIVRDEHEAEDVTQQVFIKLMTVIRSYEDRGVPFSAWILRIARNLAVDHVRRRRAVPCEEVRPSSVGREHDDHERTRSLKEALSVLPQDQCEVLVLRHVLGMSPGEIAAHLGKSEGSIHGLHHRGRSLLRRELIHLDAAPAARKAAERVLAAA
jgi:RNA polymerase sigma-70 factor (ECF subfamily)